jgi:DNA (cytosine-5)-methyltransferase 1
MKKSITKKSKSLKEEKTPCFTVAETFVGCGGSHFGFKKSGYKSVFINDIWEDAIKTLTQNDPDLNPNEVICEDIYKIDADLLHNRNIDVSNVDVFIGGVVCKGFSLAGIRNPYDERNYLYLQQLRLVKLINPKISIIENVPGMLNMKILRKTNNNDIQILCDELNDICNQQKKVRGRLIAENKKTKELLGEEGKGEQEKEEKEKGETSPNLKTELDHLNKQRKEKEALLEDYKYSVIEDIEKIYNELGYKVYKKILTCSDYGCYTNRQRLFIVAVRKDLGIEWEYPEPTTKDSRLTVKDAFDTIDYNGINNPTTDVDNRPMKHGSSTIEKFKKIQPGGKTEDSYFSRGTSSRLSFDKPAPTLVPGHSAFQIHPIEHRSITVREGATITGFDTHFKFYGSHSSRCMQIGNAIPVTMAYVMAEQCKKVLTNSFVSSLIP